MVRRFVLVACLTVCTLLSEPLLAAFEVKLILPGGGVAAAFTVLGCRAADHGDDPDADGRLTLDPSPALPFTLVATSPGGETSAPF